ncbi:MAG: hypothetical protein ACRDCW_14585 [Sarcina sp.]
MSINMKNIDEWLLWNKNFSQEERESIMKFMSDYFIDKEIVIGQDGEEIKPDENYFDRNIYDIFSMDDWCEITISRFKNPVNNEIDTYEMEYKTDYSVSTYGSDEYFIKCWDNTNELKKYLTNK